MMWSSLFVALFVAISVTNTGSAKFGQTQRPTSKYDMWRTGYEFLGPNKKCGDDETRTFRIERAWSYKCSQKCNEDPRCKFFSVVENWKSPLDGLCIGCAIAPALIHDGFDSYGLADYYYIGADKKCEYGNTRTFRLENSDVPACAAKCVADSKCNYFSVGNADSNFAGLCIGCEVEPPAIQEGPRGFDGYGFKKYPETEVCGKGMSDYLCGMYASNYVHDGDYGLPFYEVNSAQAPSGCYITAKGERQTWTLSEDGKKMKPGVFYNSFKSSPTPCNGKRECVCQKYGEDDSFVEPDEPSSWVETTTGVPGFIVTMVVASAVIALLLCAVILRIRAYMISSAGDKAHMIAAVGAGLDGAYDTTHVATEAVVPVSPTSVN